MAVLNLSITVPDSELTRTQTALKTHYAVGTNSAAVEAFRLEMAKHLKSIVREEERIASASSITDISPI